MTQSLTNAIGLEFSDPDLEAAVGVGLEAVEAGLWSAVASADPFVTEAARHLAGAGGKRVRPMLTLLAAHFGDPDAPLVIPGALVLELTHLATLYHDDVMDEAAVRRGAPSANSRWTNTVAILTGDYLFARAATIAADLGPEAVRIQAETFARLVQGQIRETVGPRVGADPVAHYLGVLADKTGSLIATCGRFGAMFSGAGPEVSEIVTRYGEVFGIAFQVSDDLLDIASEADYSGKTPGTDLREGIATLPVLYALSDDTGTDPRLRALLEKGPLTDDAEHAEALALLRVSPAMGRARETLAEYTDQARVLLERLPDVPARRALESMCDFVVARMG